MPRVRSILVSLSLFLAACSDKAAAPLASPVPGLVSDFVRQALPFSPVAAAASGMHTADGVNLDEALDSFSPAALGRYRLFLTSFRERLEREARPETLTPQDRADHDIVHDQIRAAMLELDTLQAYKHNPTVYVELIGSALFNPFVLEYAPLEKRYPHLIARMAKIPALLAEAKANLVDSPAIWTKVAAEENDGNRELIAGVLNDKCPAAQRPAFDAAAKPAIAAIDAFNAWLKSDLAKRTSDWRLGKEKYAAKLDLALALGLGPDQILADAEAELERVRGLMRETGAPLFEKMYPGQKPPTELNALVKKVLDKVAEKRSTPAKYFDDAKRDLEEARQFVRAKGLMTLPARDNLQVIETPVFMRGIYSVGGFNPAPALEPKLGAFYWLTPIPANWPKERVDSKLREYNHYGLKILTIHEAIPGHYLQFEYANDVQPEPRRVLRAVYGNGPYIEGWAVYATDLLIEQGYLDKDPELLMTWYKQYLRAVANTILDVRLHTMDMKDDEAMALMIERTFQEKEEATAKLQRAKLSSTQLPTYFTGYRAWRRLRDRLEKRPGFKLAAFHEMALRAGAVPMPALERILEVK